MLDRLNCNRQGLDLLKKLLNATGLCSALLMDSDRLRFKRMTVSKLASLPRHGGIEAHNGDAFRWHEGPTVFLPKHGRGPSSSINPLPLIPGMMSVCRRGSTHEQVRSWTVPTKKSPIEGCSSVGPSTLKSGTRNRWKKGEAGTIESLISCFVLTLKALKKPLL